MINLDDPAAPRIIERTGKMPTVTYGIDNTDADVVAESARFTIWESEIIVRTPLGKLQIISPLLGKHNVYNILAAVATGIALKVRGVGARGGLWSAGVGRAASERGGPGHTLCRSGPWSHPVSLWTLVTPFFPLPAVKSGVLLSVCLFVVPEENLHLVTLPCIVVFQVLVINRSA